ncbi:Transmembrane secretion effector [Actinokineospora iranica]|uniref:Transmembrane secretion effector n=1 Tax=Actinokineospora iranica TaxID=1271860 RepID=A0A1G6WQD3_9PSEU|nr:Transmembrane secretion effector [Actinokineospora iranica]
MKVSSGVAPSADSVPLRRNRSFVLLWAGQSVSLVGSQVTVVALPLVAVVTLGAGAWEMGVLAACGRVPYLLFGLPAGVWVDRLPRKRVLVVCGVGQAVALGVVPAAAVGGVLSLGLLAGVAFVAGVFAVFADIAALALVPLVVPRAQLTAGQGALEVGQSVSQVSGPAVAGWLVQALSAPVAIVADALSFLVSAVTAGGIRVPESAGRAVERDSMARQIAAGARAVFGKRVLRHVTLCTATHIFFYNAFTAVLVLYLVRDLALSPSVLGATLSAGAVGGLAGSAVAARLGARFGSGPTMAAAIVVAGAASCLVVAAGGAVAASVAVVAGSQALMWFAMQVYNVLQVPVRYALTPDHLHGRVNATIRTTVWGLAPLGALAGGLAGDALGVRVSLLGAGIGAAMAALWLVLGRTGPASSCAR